MRRVIGDDAIDGTVKDGLNQSLRILFGAQRRIHLERGFVCLGDVIFGKEQVVRRDLAGNLDAIGLGTADDLDAVCRSKMLDVDRTTREPAELDVAMDLDFLTGTRPTLNGETS